MDTPIEDIATVNPQLNIGGKIIKPASPKMRVWREFLAFFDRGKREMPIGDFLSSHSNLIVLAFARPEVTKETVEDNLEICEVVPFTRELFRWLQSQTFAKLVKLPNEQAGAGRE